MDHRPIAKRFFHPGFSFLFEDNGNTIEYWFSWISGLEKVYVNGALVSSIRSYRTSSTHQFAIGETKYSIHLGTNSILSSSRNCSLERSGQLIAKKEIFFLKKGQPIPIVIDTTIGIIVALLAFIICKVEYDWPQWSYYLFVSVLLVAHPLIYFWRLKPEAMDIDLP